MPDLSFARVKEVFEQWAMYDAVIQGGYMHHRELAAALAAWARKQGGLLRIVDLGCGDAWLAANAFRDANVKHYLGVDVSESAVERARGHVAIWPGRADVVAGNLAGMLHGLPDASANVVLASYSLHHFLSDAKVRLIAECGRILTRGGTLVWIDAVRDEGETRDAYIARLTHAMERDWVTLTVDQRARGCTHVRESDYPETRRWMLDCVQQAGFQLADTILETEFFDGWAFTKA